MIGGADSSPSQAREPVRIVRLLARGDPDGGGVLAFPAVTAEC
ncbi:MAG: hypothetical protein ACK56I_20670 [bacterium]